MTWYESEPAGQELVSEFKSQNTLKYLKFCSLKCKPVTTPM